MEISLPPAPARSRSSRVAARCHQAPASYVAPAFDAGRPELVRLYAVVRGSYAFRTPFVRAWYALEVVRFAFGRTLKGRTKGSTVKVQLKYGFYGTAPSGCSTSPARRVPPRRRVKYMRLCHHALPHGLSRRRGVPPRSERSPKVRAAVGLGYHQPLLLVTCTHRRCVMHNLVTPR